MMNLNRRAIALPPPLGGRLGGVESSRRTMAPAWPLARILAIAGMPLLIAGCATAPLDQAGTLSSYQGLQQADGLLAKSKIHVDEGAVLAARTVRIVPTIFAGGARLEAISDDQRKLVANAVDRSLCIGLSERLEVVPSSQPADLTVRAVVTHMDATNEAAAAASKVAHVAKTVLLPGVPAPAPRIPIGLGSLSMEAEARGGGAQQAAMVWGQGANALSDSAPVSASGDAYELASAFGDDFSKLVVSGKSPYGWSPPAPPSLQRIKTLAGGAPKYAACEAFGRSPGLVGMVARTVGAPPEWTDKGAAGASVATTAAR